MVKATLQSLGFTQVHRVLDRPLPYGYDTGATVSLLPLRFFKMLQIDRFARIKLTGILPEMVIPARLIRATLRFIDLKGLESPEIEAWIAIAEREDVPLIVGLKSIAETHDFMVNFRNRIFTLEFY